MNQPDKELPTLRVHVLGEHVFCPRAALIADESDDERGSEQELGPKLHDWINYDAHRFAEARRLAWADMRLWLTLLAPAGLLALIFWRSVSPFAGVVASLPAFYLVARLWDTGVTIFSLLRAQAAFNKAPAMDIDMAPTEKSEVNWWTLRKAGFDCIKPLDPHEHPDRPLTGKPWRMLVKDIYRIPVLCKHLGKHEGKNQHVVRLAAYCHLIEVCETAKAPFGVLKFGGSYDCWIIPNTPKVKADLERELASAWEFLRITREGKYVPAPPTDNRCSGCWLGRPRRLRKGSATILKREELDAVPVPGAEKKTYHSTCGDRFRWIPPHQRLVELEMIQSAKIL